MSARPLLVIGRGQLGQALLACRTPMRIVATRRAELDFDRPEEIAPALARDDPVALVNAAAYTAVDAAETDRAAAWRANCEGPRLLARFAARRGIPFIHVSTDYVFDGTKGASYLESDRAAPLNVYGASKLAGERAVLAEGRDVIVLRTARLISATGRNFVRALLAQRSCAEPLPVIADQRGSPTVTADLAAAIVRIIERIARTGWRDDYRGVFHAAGAGEATWYDLAQAIAAEVARTGASFPEIVPIATAERASPARRPLDSRLDSTRLAAVFGLRLSDWRGRLGPIVREILAPDAAQSPRQSTRE